MAETISVIIPAFNEAESLPICISSIGGTMKLLDVLYEIIVVDDGSRDSTQPVLRGLSAEFPSLIVISLSRNFGKEAAMAAGLMASRGHAAIIMDADLQHPPEIIPEMITEWRSGAQIVHAVKRRRGDSKTYTLFAETFNWLMTLSLGKDFQGASDFKLIDRTVVDALNKCGESHRFFRGLVAWVGFKEKFIDFDVAERRFGSTRWSKYGLVKYFIRSLLAFTSLPLRLIAIAGLGAAALGVALMLYALAFWATGQAISGFTTVIVAVASFCGTILLTQGVIAVYIAMLVDEQKRRPLFIIAEQTRSSNSVDTVSLEQQEM